MPWKTVLMKLKHRFAQRQKYMRLGDQKAFKY